MSQRIIYTVEELEEAVRTSNSIAAVMYKLGYKYNGSHATVKNRIKKFNIDTSHFTGQSHAKGMKFGPKKPIENYLNNKIKTNSHTLRLRLIKEGYFKKECVRCLNTKWLNQDIPLQLHHIDTNHFNNNLSNLEILCPNCHAMVEKPIKKYKTCLDCQIKIYKKSIRCTTCQNRTPHNQPKKINWPSKEKLEKLVWSKSTSQIAKDLGVSDNAVGKWCKKYGISKPPRGYWAKIQYGKIPQINSSLIS